jgi:hypothetical protein
MIIGHGVNQLEQRITDALCSGSLRCKESGFLQAVSRNIGLYRELVFLTHSQANWLFTILTNFEKGTPSGPAQNNGRPRPSRITPPLFSSEDTSESSSLMRALAGVDGIIWTEEGSPEAFDITQAMELNVDT